MYSQCPDCQTRFRVTAEALRAAHGTVRCGRCGAAFDALVRLSDAVPPAPPVPVSASFSIDVEPAAVEAPAAEYHFSAEDLEQVFVDEQSWSRRAVPESLPAHDAEATTAQDLEPPLIVDEADVFEDITLEGERLTAEAIEEFESGRRDLDATDEFEVLRDVPDAAYPEAEDEGGADSLVEAGGPARNASAASIEETREDEAGPGPGTGADQPVAAVTPAQEPDARLAPAPDAQPSEAPEPLWMQRPRRPEPELELEVEAEPGESTLARFAWSLGSLVLALGLATQAVHYFRQDLVRHPQIGPPLRAGYAQLGLSLLPNWDLGAFELRQWGNDANAAADGRMLVRASLTNHAAFAQPYPILRLELEDRFGSTVATRDFDPSEYLKDPSNADRLVAPGSSAEAELLLADPGREAVGYRLDICLRESARLLRCATGPG